MELANTKLMTTLDIDYAYPLISIALQRKANDLI
jgi:hypothetical protein